MSLECHGGRKDRSITIFKCPHWHPSSTVPSPGIDEDFKSMRDVVPKQIIDNLLLHEDETQFAILMTFPYLRPIVISTVPNTKYSKYSLQSIQNCSSCLPQDGSPRRRCLAIPCALS